MTRTEPVVARLNPSDRTSPELKRRRSILVALLAIGLATGAAFVSLVWLDGALRLLTAPVIRLGASAAGADHPWADRSRAPA